jgi:hypothetical protein
LDDRILPLTQQLLRTKKRDRLGGKKGDRFGEATFF